MPADAQTFCTLDSKALIIHAPGFILEIDKRTGEWRQIVTPYDGRSLVPHGSARVSFDIHLNGHWLSALNRPALVRWEQRTANGRFLVLIDIKLGAFYVRQWILVDSDGMGFQRSIDLKYEGRLPGTLRAIDLSLPVLRLSEQEAGELVLPNHLPFHTLDLETVTRRGLSRERVDEEYAAGRLEPAGAQTFPDAWNGIVGLHDPASRTGLITCLSPASAPVIHACQKLGKGFAISALQRQEMILEMGASFSTAAQHVQFFNSSWAAALEKYQTNLASWGFTLPENVPSWVTGATIYETAITQWGGCAQLTRALRALRRIGVDTVNLLPICAAAEVTEEMKLNWRLDPAWQGTVLPHRITDFESLDPQVGTENDIRKLVAAAHKLKMRVLLDFVFHGISEPSWLIQRRPHWLVRNQKGELFASHGWKPGYSLDWALPEVQDYLIDFAVRQVELFQLDGLRVESPFWKESNWQSQNGRQPCETNLAGFAIIERLRQRMRQVRPDAVLLAAAHGPAFVKCCDILTMDNVLAWLARLGRNEIDAQEMNAYLRDLRFCYPEGTRLLYALESYQSTHWEVSPRALRGSSISRPLFAVAALAGDAVSLHHGQEKGQEKFFRQLLDVRRKNKVLAHGRVLHRGVKWEGERQLVWLRRLDTSVALITVNLDSLWRRVAIEIDPELREHMPSRHRRIFPSATRPAKVMWNALQYWTVDLDAYSIQIDLFE
jgi:starch synthase (maltosyl-transferring)